jgi:SAM-dependent methyltransferase
LGIGYWVIGGLTSSRHDRHVTMSSGEIDRRIAERDAADRRYNDALTAVDRAMPVLGPASQPQPARQPEHPGWPATAQSPAMAASPGWRGRLARFIWRTVAPVFAQQQAWNDAFKHDAERTRAELESAIRELHESRAAHRHDLQAVAGFQSKLVQFLQQITPFIDTKTRVLEASVDQLRMAATSAQRTAVAARRELERIGSAGTDIRVAGDRVGPTGPPPAAAVEYVGFEDLFRGSSDEIRRRQEADADRFRGASDVLDIGCGRGEFLELLRERGVRARGVDVNAEMVEICRGRGLEAHHGDALTYLAAVGDNSLGGIVAAQVVEHLDPAHLVRLIETAHAKLRPGATIVLETINVACWVAFFESYIRDITHVRPIHPETLAFLVIAAGFEGADVHFRSPIAADGRLQRATEAGVPSPLLPLVQAFNGNVDRLNERLFTHLDYAIVAMKGDSRTGE